MINFLSRILTRTFNEQRKLFIKIFFVLFTIFMVYVIWSKHEYTASTSFVIENDSGIGLSSGLGGLASITGLSFANKNNNTLSPELISEVYNSDSFNYNILNERISVGSEEVFIKDFFNRKSKISEIFEIFKSKNKSDNDLLFIEGIVFYSMNDVKIINDFRKNYSIVYNKKLNLVSISFSSENPVLSAQLVDIIASRLQQFILTKKIEKLSNNVSYLEDVVHEKMIDFQKISDSIANFKDVYRNVKSNELLMFEMRLETNYNLEYEVLKGLNQKLEETKLNLQNQQPIFMFVKDIVVPTEPSSMSKVKMLLCLLICSFVLAVFFSNYDYLLKITLKKLNYV